MLTVALNLGRAGAEPRTGCYGRDEPVQGQGKTPALGMPGLKEQQEETEKEGETEKTRNVLFLEFAAIPALPQTQLL